MDYKSFVLNHKKQTGQTPNQLEIEQLYKEYQERSRETSIPQNNVHDSNINNKDKPKTISSLNESIQSNDIDSVKSAISQKLPFTDYSIYFAIKTGNFDIFTCVHEYVNKLTKTDLNTAVGCKPINMNIVRFILDKLKLNGEWGLNPDTYKNIINPPNVTNQTNQTNYKNLFSSTNFTKPTSTPNINKDKLDDFKANYPKLFNAINGKTNANGGLNLSQFQQEVYSLYSDPAINQMKRKDLEAFCKNKIKSLLT